MAAGYKDFTAGAVLTAADLEDYCELQGIMRFASAAARNSALSSVLTEGLFAYLIDTNSLTVYSGSAWSTIGPVHGAWTAWTPVVIQGATPTLTVNHSTYQRIGRRVEFESVVTITSTATGVNDITISLPVAAAYGSGFSILGRGGVYDDSGSTANFGTLRWASSTTVKINNDLSSGSSDYLGTSGFTAALAANDIISVRGSYEAAADS